MDGGSSPRSTPKDPTLPRSSPLSNPAIKDFLDGLAILIARRILAGTQEPQGEPKPSTMGKETVKC